MAKRLEPVKGDPGRNEGPIDSGSDVIFPMSGGKLIARNGKAGRIGTKAATDKNGLDCCCAQECLDCCGGTVTVGRCCYSDKDEIRGFVYFAELETEDFPPRNPRKTRDRFTITQSGQSRRDPAACYWDVPCDLAIERFEEENGQVTENCQASQANEILRTVPPSSGTWEGQDWGIPASCDIWGDIGIAPTQGNYVCKSPGIRDCGCWDEGPRCSPVFGTKCGVDYDVGICFGYRYSEDELEPGSCFNIPRDVPLSSCRLVDRQSFTECNDGQVAESRFYVWFQECIELAPCSDVGSCECEDT